MTKVFTIDELKSVINMKDVVESVDRTFKGLAEGVVINPTKVTLDLGENAPYPPYDGFFNAMPAYIGYQDVAGIKWVGGILGERKKAGLPFISGMILLANPRLGTFKAVMDGAYITNLRTGAQTAVALKHIYKGRKSLNVGLYGAGMQGHTQTAAIAEVFDIDKLYPAGRFIVIVESQSPRDHGVATDHIFDPHFIHHEFHPFVKYVITVYPCPVDFLDAGYHAVEMVFRLAGPRFMHDAGRDGPLSGIGQHLHDRKHGVEMLLAPKRNLVVTGY